MPKKTPEDQALLWLRQYEEEGFRTSSIAKKSKKDVRTVEDAIDQARLRRDGRSAHAAIVQRVLENHQTRLLALLDELRSVVVLPSPDLKVRYRSDEEPLSIQLTGYVITREKGQPWNVKFALEDRLEWELLQEHLKRRKTIIDTVDTWKDNLKQHIDARIQLWDKAMSMIMEKTGYPLADKPCEPPYILYDPMVQLLYETTLREKLGIPDSTDPEGNIAMDSASGEIQIHGRLVAQAPGKETECGKTIKRTFKELANMTPEALRVATTNKTLEESCSSTRRLIDEITTFGYISGRCRSCSQLGI